MVRFIELTGEYVFKWEFKESHEGTDYGYNGTTHYTTKKTHYIIAKLKGDELIDWLQNYGLTPDQMFKETNPFSHLWFGEHDETKTIDSYTLNKTAREWAENNKEIIEKNPWTVVGMNGGYVLISNGSKENTVELGSASIMNLEMNNSNTTNVKNNPNICVSARASLI
jgi:hypothetical protein